MIKFWVYGERDLEAVFTCMFLLHTWDNLIMKDNYQTN